VNAPYAPSTTGSTATRQATLGGLSAAALQGSRWIDAHLPAELFRRNGKKVDGIVIHRDELDDDEVTIVRGIATTTPARTAFDLGRRGLRVPAVVRLDALANATDLAPSHIQPLIDRHHGVRGLVQLRDVLTVMDAGAESPQETRTRLVLVDAGLPKPRTQIWVDDWRIDMGYDEFKVGVEYDGEQHWTIPLVRANDVDRHAELLARGWVIVRVSADMLRYRPHVIVLRVCAALREAGAQCLGAPPACGGVIARVLGDRVA
jgi:very-short-patch-repair endonuclease